VNFSVRNLELEQLIPLLAEAGYESIESQIVLVNGSYELKAPLEEISKLPSYHFALAVSLFAIGRKDLASEICPDLWRFIGPSGQTDVSYLLARVLSEMYRPAS